MMRLLGLNARANPGMQHGVRGPFTQKHSCSQRELIQKRATDFDPSHL